MLEDIAEIKARLYTTYRVLYDGVDERVGRVASNRTLGLFALCDNHVKSTDIVCEVGSFSGVSSEVFSLYAKEVHCIDTWKPCHEMPSLAAFVEAEKLFDAMVKRRGNVIKKKGTSYDVALDYVDGYFDLIYIDASHRYIDVVEDIGIWSRVLKPNGLMTGHDFDIPDVKRAVLKMFPSRHIIVYDDQSWVVYAKEDSYDV